MMLHVLPGDSYVDAFRGTGLVGELAIFRECLIDGDLLGDSLSEFWTTRENYLSSAYPDDTKSYRNDVAAEIEKLLRAGEGDEINLWFEYELFCSVNYWFCLNLLQDSKAEIYRVSPTIRKEESKWRGFGQLTSDEMLSCYKQRTRITSQDLTRGSELWQAFKSGDLSGVAQLGNYDSPAFPHLREVTIAAGEMENRPRQILEQIQSAGNDDFREIFSEFSARAGVYGLGDTQVRKLLADLKPDSK